MPISWPENPRQTAKTAALEKMTVGHILWFWHNLPFCSFLAHFFWFKLDFEDLNPLNVYLRVAIVLSLENFCELKFLSSKCIEAFFQISFQWATFVTSIDRMGDINNLVFHACFADWLFHLPSYLLFLELKKSFKTILTYKFQWSHFNLSKFKSWCTIYYDWHWLY